MTEDREEADGTSEGDRWIALSAFKKRQRFASLEQRIEYETDLSFFLSFF